MRRVPYNHPRAAMERAAIAVRQPPIADPGNFLWKTRSAGGGRVRVNDMKTDHIFFSLRFVFNSLAPAELRVGPSDATSDAKVLKWNRTYLRQATRALLHVLSKRTDLPSRLQKQYAQMAERCCQNPAAYFEIDVVADAQGSPLPPTDAAQQLPPGTVRLADGSVFDPNNHFSDDQQS